MILTLDNPIVTAIKALYGFAQGVDKGIDDLLEKMKGSEDSTVVRSANVIEGAKYGFGIGYGTSVIVIAVGQIILGNPLSAAWAVGTGLTLTNPIAMTCGAIGAIYYGWKALSEEERNAILHRLMQAFDVGVEMIRAMINFVVAKTKELLNNENFVAFRKFISDSAATFGHTLADVTRAVRDRVGEAIDSVATTVVDAADAVSIKAVKTAAETQEFIKDRLSRPEGQSKEGG